MAMTGFDPELVKGSMSKVEDAYDKLMTALETKVQSEFVNPMAENWACNQAQTFFTNNFKPSIDSLLSSSFSTFQSVIMSMNSAASNWAKNTGTTWGAHTFRGTKKTIDVSGIKENINGVRGVNETEANNTAAKLPVIAREAEAALTSAQQAVNGCGFVGRGMEETLVNSLQIIKTKISTSTDELSEAIKKVINTTVDNYGSLAEQVEEAFTVQDNKA